MTGSNLRHWHFQAITISTAWWYEGWPKCSYLAKWDLKVSRWKRINFRQFINVGRWLRRVKCLSWNSSSSLRNAQKAGLSNVLAFLGLVLACLGLVLACLALLGGARNKGLSRYNSAWNNTLCLKQGGPWGPQHVTCGSHAPAWHTHRALWATSLTQWLSPESC